MIICEFTVPYRPVPWTPPRVTGKGKPYKNNRLVVWQGTVATYARLAMGGRPPFAGPVEVAFHFGIRPRAGPLPDTTNLQKSTEDALQGSIIVNDRNVGLVSSRRTVGDWDGAVIRVSELEG